MTKVIIKNHCRNRQVYHTEMCRNAKLIENKRKVDMEIATRMPIRECKYCKND